MIKLNPDCFAYRSVLAVDVLTVWIVTKLAAATPTETYVRYRHLFDKAHASSGYPASQYSRVWRKSHGRKFIPAQMLGATVANHFNFLTPSVTCRQ